VDREMKVSPKLRYSSPVLWVHGSIEKLTQTSAKMGLLADTRSGMSDMRTT
jgi:hypothetical protein